ncbi:MAG TPA: OsmC family protein [Cellulomonas sp.]
MPQLHQYSVDLAWTGVRRSGTTSFTTYGRDHELRAGDRPVILATSDPHFRGDPQRWSPEDLLVSSLAQCHMIWLLHLAARDGVAVLDYADSASGTIRVESAGQGHFTEVVLHPRVAVAAGATLPDGSAVTDDVMGALHAEAQEHCFIARSVNFPVRVQPTAVAFLEPAAPAAHDEA